MTYIAIDHQGVRIWEYRDESPDWLEQEVREELEADFENLIAD
ncbi:MAG TPA: hypothetical protein VF133_15275 [Terriglobales bacterium]